MSHTACGNNTLHAGVSHTTCRNITHCVHCSVCDADLPSLPPTAPMSLRSGDVTGGLCSQWRLHSRLSGLFKQMALNPARKGRSGAWSCRVTGRGWGGRMKMLTSMEPSASIFSAFPPDSPLTASDSSSLLPRALLGAESLVQGVLDLLLCLSHRSVPWSALVC